MENTLEDGRTDRNPSCLFSKYEERNHPIKTQSCTLVKFEFEYPNPHTAPTHKDKDYGSIDWALALFCQILDATQKTSPQPKMIHKVNGRF